MFSRWPRYLSHGPAIEMWSVVHLPLALRRIGRSSEVVAVPRLERLEQLQAIAGRRHDDLDRRAVLRRRDEAGLARVEAAVRAAPRRPAART